MKLEALRAKYSLKRPLPVTRREPTQHQGCADCNWTCVLILVHGGEEMVCPCTPKIPCLICKDGYIKDEHGDGLRCRYCFTGFVIDLSHEEKTVNFSYKHLACGERVYLVHKASPNVYRCVKCGDLPDGFSQVMGGVCTKCSMHAMLQKAEGGWWCSNCGWKP